MDIPKPDNLHDSLNMSKFRESWTGNAIKEASEEMVNKFCDIDYHNEIAVIAESDSNGEKRNVGVVRLFIDPGEVRIERQF
jgi:hypothetical protein